MSTRDSQFDIDRVLDRREAWNKMRLSTPEQLVKRYPVDPLGFKGRDGYIPMREFIGYEADGRIPVFT